MRVSGKEMREKSNVLALFGPAHTGSLELGPDPLQELLNEAEAEAWDQLEEAEEAPMMLPARILVTESQFPDQSLFLLEKQLEQLNASLVRLRFYLSDLDDLLPR